MFGLQFTIFTKYKYIVPSKKTVPHIIECRFICCISMLIDMKNSAQLLFLKCWFGLIHGLQITKLGSCML